LSDASFSQLGAFQGKTGLLGVTNRGDLPFGGTLPLKEAYVREPADLSLAISGKVERWLPREHPVRDIRAN